MLKPLEAKKKKKKKWLFDYTMQGIPIYRHAVQSNILISYQHLPLLYSSQFFNKFQFFSRSNFYINMLSEQCDDLLIAITRLKENIPNIFLDIGVNLYP